jgi:hypothetical protein
MVGQIVATNLGGIVDVNFVMLIVVEMEGPNGSNISLLLGALNREITLDSSDG